MSANVPNFDVKNMLLRLEDLLTNREMYFKSLSVCLSGEITVLKFEYSCSRTTTIKRPQQRKRIRFRTHALLLFLTELYLLQHVGIIKRYLGPTVTTAGTVSSSNPVLFGDNSFCSVRIAFCAHFVFSFLTCTTTTC